jgi:cell division protein FtsI/penicillin-binding protein 2
MLLLFQESWWNGINAVWGLLIILIMVGMAVIVLLAKRKDETALTNEKSSQANAALVAVRDKQITDLEKKVVTLEEELEEVTAEYKTVVSMKVDDMIRWYQYYQDKEAHWRNVDEENTLLRKQIATRGQ